MKSWRMECSRHVYCNEKEEISTELLVEDLRGRGYLGDVKM
jgi:hypothetical protein